MGEFTNDYGPPTTQEPEKEEEKSDQEEVQGIPTDVEGVMADDEVQHGKDRFPVFNVSKDEFYQNMKYGRKRLRFKSGSGAQQYMNKTKYNRPFHISYTDSNGKKYTRRIK